MAVMIALLGVSILGLTLVIGLAAAVFMGMRRHIVVSRAGVPPEWMAPRDPLAVARAHLAALYVAVSRRYHAREQLPTIPRWSPLLGAGIVLALWGFSMM